MVGTEVPDLPKKDNQFLVNIRQMIADLSVDLRSISTSAYAELEEDLERLGNFLKVTKYRQSREMSSPGSVQVKPIHGCGPYGYLVVSNHGSVKWKYLGKDVDGYGEGYYPPGTPMRFKKRTGFEYVGDWSGKRIRDDAEEVDT